MISAGVDQFQRRAAQLDRALADHHFIGNQDVRGLERRQTLLGALVRDDPGAGILERFASGSVVIMVVAVDQIFDGLIGNFLDLGDIGYRRLRAPVADRIGGNHAGRRDDEHRLVILIAEDINVVGPFNLGRRE